MDYSIIFYHIGCAFNLHSIINNGLIPGGQNSSKRQTVFFLPIDPRDKGHQDPAQIDFSVPRRAQYLHSAWKKHQDAVFWVDIDLAIRKGLTFYQTRSNAIILQGTLPAYCIPKVVRLKTGEVLYENAYMSPRPPPKISLHHDWTKELDSKVVQQPEGKVFRQSCGEVQRATFSQLTQPKPKPICDRSGKLDSTEDVETVFSVRSWNSVVIPSGQVIAVTVNTIPPNTEKWLRKSYMKTMATVYSYENECDELQHHNQEKLERRAQQQAAHHAQQVHQ